MKTLPQIESGVCCLACLVLNLQMIIVRAVADLMRYIVNELEWIFDCIFKLE